MATAEDLTRIALSLPDTSAHPHFDRTAFKVVRIYATLAADGRSGNLLLTPDEQAFKCMMAPDVFSPIPNAWGRKGHTTVDLAAITEPELRAALEMAHAHGAAKRPAKRRR